VVQQGTLLLSGSATSTQFTDPAFLSTQPGTTFNVRGPLTGTTRDADLYSPLGAVVLSGPGTAAAPQLFEVMGQDRGNVAAWSTRNFQLGTLQLSGTYARLVDNADNAAGTGAEALYVDNLIVPAGSTLDLNLFRVYARSTQIAGTVVGGTINAAPDGGPLALGTPTPGAI